jgi:hypothetical protein
MDRACMAANGLLVSTLFGIRKSRGFETRRLGTQVHGPSEGDFALTIEA